MIDYVPVTCPWCFEPGEVAVEADLAGTFVVDCEVCCRPWRVIVEWSETGPRVCVDRS